MTERGKNKANAQSNPKPTEKTRPTGVQHLDLVLFAGLLFLCVSPFRRFWPKLCSNFWDNHFVSTAFLLSVLLFLPLSLSLVQGLLVR